jgi:RNA polymerase sigma-70 factor (sigma-E family)
MAPNLPRSAAVRPADGFDAFFGAHYPATVRLAHLLTGSNLSAEDLAQDAFARVLPHHGKLDNPAAYLRTATINVCRSWHRSRGREQDRFRRHGPSPDIAISAASAELLDSIRRLPYRQQAVLVLRYWLDLSEADIAITLGCRPGTVKSLHARALEAIRKDLP